MVDFLSHFPRVIFLPPSAATKPLVSLWIVQPGFSIIVKRSGWQSPAMELLVQAVYCYIVRLSWALYFPVAHVMG